MSGENWSKFEGKKMCGIDVPQGIDFYTKDEKKMKININYPQTNMQDDKAAFEAWALIFHTSNKYEVTLSFKEINWDGTIVKLSEGQPNYMRFLYRVWKFNEQMIWFNIEKDNQNVINKFKSEFIELKSKRQLLNNIPKMESKVSLGNKGTEHFFENTFIRVGPANKILKNIVEVKNKTKLVNLYNQLPNGLFKGSYKKDIKELTRIFPTGYFDMWGISEDKELCIFELKVVDPKREDVYNKSAGIISELFFYANYSKDIFMDNNCYDSKKVYRGYEELLCAAKEGIPMIKAYFLAPMYQTRIEENIDDIESCLNNNNFQIEYRFLHYSYNQIKPLVVAFKERNKNNLKIN